MNTPQPQPLPSPASELPPPEAPGRLFLQLVQDDIDETDPTSTVLSSEYEGYAHLLQEMDALWATIKADQDSEELLDRLVSVASLCARFAGDLVLPEMDANQEVK